MEEEEEEEEENMDKKRVLEEQKDEVWKLRERKRLFWVRRLRFIVMCDNL